MTLARPASSAPSRRRFRYLSVRARRGLVLPALLLLLWELSAHLGWVDRRFLPPLEQVAATALHELRDGDLLLHLSASLSRNLTGFAIGSAAGVVFGAWLGLSRTARELINPTFNALKQIAVLAWIPLISIWFGFAEIAKVTFIALAAFVPVALNTFEGMGSAPPQILEVARSLCLSRSQTLRRVYLPAAVPSILTGIHLGLIYAWLATVAAQYFMTVVPGPGGVIIVGREGFVMGLGSPAPEYLGVVGHCLNWWAHCAVVQ